MTLSVTTEFREEYEAERSAWLRKRFLWYAGFGMGLNGLSIIASVVAMFFIPRGQILIEAIELVGTIPSWVLYAAGFLYVLRNPIPRERLLRLVYWIIVAGGSIGLLIIPVVLRMQFALLEAQGLEGPVNTATIASVTGVTPLIPIFFSHLFASLFIPWSPKEAVQPLIPLLLVNALVILGTQLTWPETRSWIGVFAVAFSPFVGVPGVLICALRHSRFRKKFLFRTLRGRYGEMKRELIDARRIHEGLFPKPLVQGPVVFDYRYEPMRQIGGDYLFARTAFLPDEEFPVLDLIIVDVTGHGISAALAVNRLHGEIAREYGEKPDASPGEVLKGLNAYLNYSLASHSVYATAICVRVDPNRDELRWASAGHPPAFLRTSDGRLDRLGSTTFLLGVCAAGDFVPNEQTMRFMPGDALIAYTDGATEAVGRDGRMLRVDGIQRMIASIDPGDAGRVDALIRAVDEYRDGPVKDDTLIVEIMRVLRSAQARSETTSPAQITMSTGSPPNS